MPEAEAPVRALFDPDGDGFAAAPITGGPWDEAMMHGAAPSALLARAIEHTEPGSELAVTRLTIEFLGGVPVGPVAVATSVAKPGRRFQIVDATLQAGGRSVCLARAVRLRRADLPDAAAAPAPWLEPLPTPATGDPLPQFVDVGRPLSENSRCRPRSSAIRLMSLAWSPSTNVTPMPARPARPVRPMRWT